jgi:hypothetical protein
VPALAAAFPIAPLVVVPGQPAAVRVVDVDAGAWIIIVALPAPIGIAPGSRIADAAIAIAGTFGRTAADRARRGERDKDHEHLTHKSTS